MQKQNSEVLSKDTSEGQKMKIFLLFPALSDIFWCFCDATGDGNKIKNSTGNSYWLNIMLPFYSLQWNFIKSSATKALANALLSNTTMELLE